MAARVHGLEEMVEFLEQEMADSDQYDHLSIMDEAEKYQARARMLTPLQPLSAEGSAQLSQWPMVNLRAKEVERSAQIFDR